MGLVVFAWEGGVMALEIKDNSELLACPICSKKPLCKYWTNIKVSIIRCKNKRCASKVISSLDGEGEDVVQRWNSYALSSGDS